MCVCAVVVDHSVRRRFSFSCENKTKTVCVILAGLITNARFCFNEKKKSKFIKHLKVVSPKNIALSYLPVLDYSVNVYVEVR